ncbi:AMP-binding protein [Streptomyces sp. SID4919]|uniref:long-chain-fatty-acid--CoA ligase n=1 Tax=unclassified Streptomyces TaxID=2593676 RepID=UPI000823EA72|nr:MULTISPECIES: long-chain fatty acid--CoA ligase [unclassified Streptomyces]MYY09701.1 AMP-binding protein [Streptomyces sp. SID4919]SCK35648.1 long-chain acyl-CoA synthetase [Streptomyces sp. AmelKG-E11A]
MSLSVASVLGESARLFPDRTAVVEGANGVTYRELWREALRCAAALRESGVRPGDRVAVLLPNTTDFLRVYFGVLAAGATVVPVHALLVADEVAYVLRHSGATALVSDGPLWPVAEEAARAAGVRGVRGVPLADEPLPAAADGIAVILYTSGTTGRPKGACPTHLGIVLNASVTAQDLLSLGPDDVVLGCLPLFHSYGQTCAMNATLRVGATLVLMPRFSGPAALDALADADVTVFMGVPTMYHAFVEAAAVSTRRPGALRTAVSGGAALPVAVLERFESLFATRVFEGYGLTETSPVATFNQPRTGCRPGTVGHPVWGVEVAVADALAEDAVRLLPDGEIGEVVVRGHNVFAGYLDDPAATAAAVVDGWLRTGDLEVRGADGFLSVVDREKDLIIRGGFNVCPREVEEVLVRHPAVSEVAVIGVPDPARGEEVCAVVVLRKDSAGGITGVNADKLVDWSRERLGAHKYPRLVRFTDALPLGPSGKILKRELAGSHGVDQGHGTGGARGAGRAGGPSGAGGNRGRGRAAGAA